MNNELTIFENEEFGNLRVSEKNGQPYVCLADVCKILEIGNVSQLKSRLNQDGVIINEVIDKLGRKQGATFINESNLYRVIFQSRKHEAERFTDWVTCEVLPTIRKHGAYITEQKIEEIILNPDTVIKLAQELKAEREEKKKLADKIEFDKPKVLFANSVTSSATTILVRELSKLLKQNNIDIGQNRLYKYLRENGYILKNSTEPTQKSMNLGLFEVEERTYYVKEQPRISRVTKVTGKGQIYFINKLTKERDYARGF